MRKSVVAFIVVLCIATGFVAGCTNPSQNHETSQLPIANAGGDKQASVGSLVTLDGSGSHLNSASDLAYNWSFISVPKGSNVRLSNQTLSHASFVPDKVGSYVASLIVKDGTGAQSNRDTAHITVIAAERSETNLTATPPTKSDLYLDDQIEITGRLVDANGNGIAGQVISFKAVARVMGITTDWPVNNTTTNSTGGFTMLSDPVTPHDAPSFIKDVDLEAWAVYAGNDLYKPSTTPHVHLTIHLTSSP